MKKLLLMSFVVAQSLLGQEPAPFECASDYPVMGDWAGRWVDPIGGHEKHHPELYAQLLPMGKGTYRVVLLPDLYKRAEPYLDVVVPGAHDKVVLDLPGYDITFTPEGAQGKARLHGHMTTLELGKHAHASPTLGQAPPEGAIVLFDGTDTSMWRHTDGRPVTWQVKGDALEVVSEFWHQGENRKEGLGGMIGTKETFRNFHLHLEFRYPVEEGKRGQDRGNSGLFLHPVGELQILNSYTTPGYYDECGSFYRMLPAKVNAAGPPLQWQTYDVEVTFLPGEATVCEVTAHLNGHLIHNRVRLPSKMQAIQILLQDHINRMQFRNIWVKSMDD